MWASGQFIPNPVKNDLLRVNGGPLQNASRRPSGGWVHYPIHEDRHFLDRFMGPQRWAAPVFDSTGTTDAERQTGPHRPMSSAQKCPTGMSQSGTGLDLPIQSSGRAVPLPK